MVAMQRVRVAWSGFSGGPGLSTFYFADAAAALPAVRSFFLGINNRIPSGVLINIHETGDTLESTTGAISGQWAGSGQATVGGIGTADYAAPVGAQVSWLTTVIVEGRRVKGRTFLVPLSGDAFDGFGTLDTNSHDLILTHANMLWAALPAGMMIFQRPRVATPQWTDVRGLVHPAVSARAGTAAAVSGAIVPLKAAVLTSRRD